ncbi:hypothetical protein ElyMa_003399100 [Elysia marginata]|uniref:Tetraspanin n=1 Tax=Elysia marginata TaxID=1093978 RepID=A0AAV4JM15_9GAST|nr:hypothetical protein ElyMa_003399100 [Elysia marginata]
MTIEKSAWYNALKYGYMFQRVQNFALVTRLIIQVLALGLLLIGALVLAAAFTFKHESGYFLQETLGSTDLLTESPAAWSNVFTMTSLNLDGCLSSIIQSVYNGFTVILLSGLLCVSLGFWRSNILDYTCLMFLLLAMACQAKEMKNFDHVLTPLQATAMERMKYAINERKSILGKEYLSTLDFLMIKGDCCGVISGGDMDLFSFNQAKQHNPKSKNLGSKAYPFISPCWRADQDHRNKTLKGVVIVVIVVVVVVIVVVVAVVVAIVVVVVVIVVAIVVVVILVAIVVVIIVVAVVVKEH